MLFMQAGNDAAFPHGKPNTITRALDALKRGWSVIPLISGDDTLYGKRPTMRWQRYQDTPPAEETVHDWFIDKDCSAYGVVCGNGLIVIDFDEVDQQVRFMQQFPELLDTRVVQSGGRGLWHLYFQVDFPVASQKLNGVDLQSGGRYVVGAGSQIAGGEWTLVSDQPLRSLSRDELDAIIHFLDPNRKKQQPVDRVSIDPTQLTSPNYFAALYRAKVIEFRGRNDALFYTACQMRDAGFSQPDVVGTLADLHAKQSPVGSHCAESHEQRYKEAESTIRSVFSRPARQPFSPPPPKQDDACYLPNTLREEILTYEDGSAFLRTLEALILRDVQPGDELSEREMCELLAGDVGRWSIRKALTFSPPLRLPTHADADSAIAEGCTKNCVFVPAPKPDKSPAHRPAQRFIMPIVAYLCELFKVQSKGSDPITAEDVKSPKTYRSALNRELIRRRPGKYTQKWLGNRLNVSRNTIQRYINDEPIKSRWIFEQMTLHWNNLNQIPTGYYAEAAGIAIQHCFLQDEKGKRYPPDAGLARKLLGKGKKLWLMTRVCKSYWIEEPLQKPELLNQMPHMAEEGEFFPKYSNDVDYEVIETDPIAPLDTENTTHVPSETAKNDIQPVDDESEPEPETGKERSARYDRRPLPDDRDEYTATLLYESCGGKMRREEARKLVDVYGRQVVGRARWWMEELMKKDYVKNPPGFFKAHVRAAWINVHGTSPPEYTAPPKRKPRKKPYDWRTDPIWQSEGYRQWRMAFEGAPREIWELPEDSPIYFYIILF